MGEVPVDPPVGNPPDTEEPATAANITLTGLTFKNVGRKGDALRVGIKGGDTKKATSAAVLRMLDEGGQPVTTFDTDWDGVPDSAERRFHFETSTLDQATFTTFVLIPGIYDEATSKVAKVLVMLEDESGGRSASKTQALAKQVERKIFEACDPGKTADRCPTGMACSGTPATCVEGSAPIISRAKYYGGSSPAMLFEGVEADEDLKEVSIEYLNAQGEPTTLPLEIDESQASGFKLLAPTLASQNFVVGATPASNFSTYIPKVAATVKDNFGNSTSRMILSAEARPQKSAGQVCDANGFDACAPTYVCSPGVPDADNKCVAAAATRTAKCSKAPLLNPAKGVTKAFGRNAGVSLWNAPEGCVGPDVINGRPESAIRLRLDNPVATLTVTSALAETDHDTAVYILPGCAETSATALGCNDDTKGYTSTVTLNNVPKGDYTIIVESVQMRGGFYGVQIEAK